jgi:hypothetical protein
MIQRTKKIIKMSLLITLQVFSFPFSAVSAGKIPNGWKLERKLRTLKVFHLLQDF